MDPADVQLLDRLSAIVAVVDPVPEHIFALGRAAFGFRDPDAELMEVVELDSARLEPVRGGGATSRMHFFEFGEMSVDVEITSTGVFAHIVGMVADPGGTTDTSVTLETKAASFTGAPDEEGRFDFRQVPAGLIRLILERADRPRLVTPWFDAE